MQEEHLDENLPLSAHIMRRIAVDAYEQAKNEEENQPSNHTFVINNKEDLADVMTRILKGISMMNEKQLIYSLFYFSR